MTKWVDVGEEATGFIAVGQQATGFIAVGQSALGFVAIGQLARGVITVGQLSIGVAALGQLAVGPAFAFGMVGIGGFFGGGGLLAPSMKLRARDGSIARVVKVSMVLALIVFLWAIAAMPWYHDLFPRDATPLR